MIIVITRKGALVVFTASFIILIFSISILSGIYKSNQNGIQNGNRNSANPFQTMNAASGRNHLGSSPEQVIKTEYYTISVPEEWKVRKFTGSTIDIDFYKEDKMIGRLWGFNYLVFGNHYEILEEKHLTGFKTDVLMVRLARELPAAARSNATTEELHFYFPAKPDKEVVPFNDGVVFDLMFLTDYIDEQSALNIVKGFRLNPFCIAYNAENPKLNAFLEREENVELAVFLVQQNEKVEIFDITQGKVIQKSDTSAKIQSEALQYLSRINSLFVKVNAFPDKGYIIKVPFELPQTVQNQYLNQSGINAVNEVFILLPPEGEPYLLVLDDQGRPFFYNFEGNISALLQALQFQPDDSPSDPDN